jgi:Uma2 family endonuclease
MLAVRTPSMSFEDYLVWEADQVEKHEYVDGVPVLRRLRLMSGGTYVHIALAANIVGSLRERLRGGPCRAVGSDLKVRSLTGNARYPDVVVDCGPLSRTLIAPDPRVLFEVLSPSNSTAHQVRLVADYQAMPSVQQIVFIEQDRPAAMVWSRTDQGWAVDAIEGLETILPLSTLGVELPLVEVYEGVTFEDEAV